jgi:transposase
MVGVTWWNFHFGIFPGSIRSPQVVEFLEHLLRHLPGKLLIGWDGRRSHRSPMVGDFVRQQRGRLFVGFLPAYAPELNSVECLWSHWKHHELPNFCPQDFGQLSCRAGRALCRMAAAQRWSAPSGSRQNCFPSRTGGRNQSCRDPYYAVVMTSRLE